jgi:hypothetical protein
MILSEVREGLPFKVISRHVKSPKTTNVNLSTSPDPNNSMY